jgi:hypothetical protein
VSLRGKTINFASKSSLKWDKTNYAWDARVKANVMVPAHNKKKLSTGTAGTVYLASGKKVVFNAAKLLFQATRKSNSHPGGTVAVNDGSKDKHISFSKLKSFTIDSFKKVSGKTLLDVRATLALKDGSRQVPKFTKIYGFSAVVNQGGSPRTVRFNGAEGGKQSLRRIVFK